MLSVRHVNQTSKNVAVTTFNDKIMNSDCIFSLPILNKLTCVILSLGITKNFVQIFLTALGNVSKTYWFLLKTFLEFLGRFKVTLNKSEPSFLQLEILQKHIQNPVKHLKRSSFFAKSSILVVWGGSEYIFFTLWRSCDSLAM